MSDERKHILIADCDEEVLISLERTLEDEGFDTATAWSTSQAQQMVESGRFDLLLLADHSPELCWEPILRQARERNGAVLAFVIHSRPRHPFVEPFFLQRGATGVLNKWRPREVLTAVREALLPAANGALKRAVAACQKVG